MHGGRAAGREQREQRCDAAALPHGIFVLTVFEAQAQQRPGSLLVHGGRAAGREQRDQRRDAPALPHVVAVLNLVIA